MHYKVACIAIKIVKTMNASSGPGGRLVEFFVPVKASLTARGFILALVVPVAWILFLYGLVAHLLFAVGRWPNFGETFTGALDWHTRAIVWSAVAMYLSLYVAGPLFLL